MMLPLACLFSEASADASISTGKERDTESGNVYFGARYYASSMGRWMSPDPSMESEILELPQTWNRYSYEYNRPLYGTDPDGRCPPCIGAIIGGVVEGGFDLGKQFINNGYSLDIGKKGWEEVGANFVGGAVAGALAGATGGASLVGSALIGDVAAGTTSGIVGGIVTRSLDPNATEEPLSLGAVSEDAVAGFVGGGLGHIAADSVHIPVHIPEDPTFNLNGRNGRANNQTYRQALRDLRAQNTGNYINQGVRSGISSSAATHTTNALYGWMRQWFSSGPHCYWQMESVDVTINGVTTPGQTHDVQVCN
jgi:RHS repeat-associated protein